MMMMNRERLLALREEMEQKAIKKAKGEMKRFTKYTKKDYILKWFHKEVCKYLDKLEKGEIKKLMIFIPPQHGKSELSSRRFPAYVLGKNPKLHVGVCSCSADLANRFNRDIQNIITGKEYKRVFPKTRIKEVGAVLENGEIRTTAFFETLGDRGSCKTVGLGGMLTGNQLDIGIIDDPFKDRADANSKASRERAWDWYQDVFLQRLHNDSRQLMLFTRWHQDDLAGRILDPKNPHYDEEEAKEWTVLRIPAIKEVGKWLDCEQTIDDKREPGEALWEERHSKKKYEKMQRINPTGYNSLAQQRPAAAAGNKIKGDWFIIKRENELPFNLREIVPIYFVDGAFTENTKNDETALGSFYFNKTDKKLYIINCMGVRKELYELLKFFKQYVLANYYKPQSSVFIELKASGEGLKSMLRKIEYGAFNVRGVNSKTVSIGKFNRVENGEAFLASERVVLVEGGWNKAFIEQCKAFPNGLHDDMVDVLMYAIDHFFIATEGSGVTYN